MNCPPKSPEYRPGDLVLRRTPGYALKASNQPTKFADKYQGPYTVIKRLTHTTYIIDIYKKQIPVHVTELKPYTHYHTHLQDTARTCRPTVFMIRAPRTGTTRGTRTAVATRQTPRQNTPVRGTARNRTRNVRRAQRQREAQEAEQAKQLVNELKRRMCPEEKKKRRRTTAPASPATRRIDRQILQTLESLQQQINAQQNSNRAENRPQTPIRLPVTDGAVLKVTTFSAAKPLWVINGKIKQAKLDGCVDNTWRPHVCRHCANIYNSIPLEHLVDGYTNAGQFLERFRTTIVGNQNATIDDEVFEDTGALTPLFGLTIPPGPGRQQNNMPRNVNNDVPPRNINNNPPPPANNSNILALNNNQPPLANNSNIPASNNNNNQNAELAGTIRQLENQLQDVRLGASKTPNNNSNNRVDNTMNRNNSALTSDTTLSTTSQTSQVDDVQSTPVASRNPPSGTNAQVLICEYHRSVPYRFYSMQVAEAIPMNQVQQYQPPIQILTTGIIEAENNWTHYIRTVTYAVRVRSHTIKSTEAFGYRVSRTEILQLICAYLPPHASQQDPWAGFTKFKARSISKYRPKIKIQKKTGHK